MFNPHPIKLPRDIYYFRKEQNLKSPTIPAFLLGGLFIHWGYTPIFEAPYDQMKIDLYIPSWNPHIFIEVYGERLPEQHKSDSNRDGYLVRQGKSVQRINNQDIVENIPPLEQIRLYFLGVAAYEKQLRSWKESGIIPDYQKDNHDVTLSTLSNDFDRWFEETPDVKNDSTLHTLSDDINQWFGGSDLVN